MQVLRHTQRNCTILPAKGKDLIVLVLTLFVALPDASCSFITVQLYFM